MKESIEHRLRAIEERNQRVENDKIRETSWARKLSIMALTYLVVVVYLKVVVHITPWINALVPVIGYTLSTLTLSLLKEQWLKHKTIK